ncbi:MAG: YgjV family protein [Candidatus Latescibacterota bacterium]
MSPFVLSQVLAGLAFGLGLMSVQFRSRRRVLLCLALSTAANASHFVLLGRHAAAALLVLIGVRYLVAIAWLDRRLMYLFLLATAAGFAATWDGPLGLLALLAALVGTYGSFQAADRTLRRCLIAGNSAWLLHNALAMTPVAALMEAFNLTSNVLAYWRFHARRRTSSQAASVT